MPGPVLCSLQILIYLILTTTLWGSYYYYPNFTDGETEAKRGSLPKVMRLVRGGARIWAQTPWLRSPSSEAPGPAACESDACPREAPQTEMRQPGQPGGLLSSRSGKVNK